MASLARLGWIGLLVFGSFACEPAVAVQLPARQRVDPDPATMLCVPEPESDAPLRGRVAPGGWWEPRCLAGWYAAPCELGPACSADGSCSCRCEHAGDCREMTLGFATMGGPEGRSSDCVRGRCVWGPT